MMMPAGCSVSDLMVARLAAQIPNGGVAQVGAFTPLALAAALLAKATHAPDALVYAIGPSGVESTAVFPLSLHMLEPMSLARGYEMQNREIVDRMQSKGVPYEPISPAQLDRFGNINLTRISRPGKPPVAFPGSAGLDSLALMNVPLLGYVTRHSSKIFVEAVEFITAPGHVIHGRTRRDLGLSEHGGIGLVITNLCEMRYSCERNAFELISLHPGVSLEEVRANTGFEFLHDVEPAVTALPDAEIVRILHEDIDPLNVRRLEFSDARSRRAIILDLLERETALLESLAKTL